MVATRSADLLIIGGGINGAAVARDAAGRGLKVMLAEQFGIRHSTLEVECHDCADDHEHAIASEPAPHAHHHH